MEQPAAPIEPKPLHHISVMPVFGDEVGSRALQDEVVHDYLTRFEKKTKSRRWRRRYSRNLKLLFGRFSYIAADNLGYVSSREGNL